MANKEHLTKLREGADSWNQWREEYTEVKPDLSGHSFRRGQNFSNYNFSSANLRGTNLSRSILKNANLENSEVGIRDSWRAPLVAFSAPTSFIFGIISLCLLNLISPFLFFAIPLIIPLTLIYFLFSLVCPSYLKPLIAYPQKRIANFLVNTKLSRVYDVFLLFAVGPIVFVRAISTSLVAFIPLLGNLLSILVFDGFFSELSSLFLISISILWMSNDLEKVRNSHHSLLLSKYLLSILDPISTNFYSSDLTDANLSNVSLRFTNLIDCNLTRTNFLKCKDFHFARFNHRLLINSKIRKLLVEQDAFFFNPQPGEIIDLSGSCLKGANLRSLDLRGASLNNSNLHEADLSYSNLSSATICRSDLSKVKLYETNLSGARLNSSDLSDIDFRFATLDRASFYEAILHRSNFCNLPLSLLDMKYAEFNNVNLARVVALGTDFSSANFTGVCIEDWKINANTKLDGIICKYYYKNVTGDGKSFFNRCPDKRLGDFTIKDAFIFLEGEVEPTVDIPFPDEIDWVAFLEVFQILNEENKFGQDIFIRAIEKKESKEGSAFVIRVAVPPGTDKLTIEQAIRGLYDNMTSESGKTQSSRDESNAQGEALVIIMHKYVQSAGHNSNNAIFSNSPVDGSVSQETGNQVNSIDFAEVQDLNDAIIKINKVISEVRRKTPIDSTVQDEAAKILAEQAKKNPSLIDKFKVWSKSLAENFSKTAATESGNILASQAGKVLAKVLQMLGVSI